MVLSAGGGACLAKLVRPAHIEPERRLARRRAVGDAQALAPEEAVVVDRNDVRDLNVVVEPGPTEQAPRGRDVEREMNAGHETSGQQRKPGAVADGDEAAAAAPPVLLEQRARKGRPPDRQSVAPTPERAGEQNDGRHPQRAEPDHPEVLLQPGAEAL